MQLNCAISLDEADKVDFLGSLAVLSGLAYEPTPITRILSQEGLMERYKKTGLTHTADGRRGKERTGGGVEQGGTHTAGWGRDGNARVDGRSGGARTGGEVAR